MYCLNNAKPILTYLELSLKNITSLLTMSLVQVITTSIPLAGEDLEGMAGSQYDGMVHNLMYGNQQGYQVSELSIQMKQFFLNLFLDEKQSLQVLCMSIHKLLLQQAREAPIGAFLIAMLKGQTHDKLRGYSLCF